MLGKKYISMCNPPRESEMCETDLAPPAFRARCEALATSLRMELDLTAYAPLPADRLAAHLGVEVLLPCEISGAEAGYILLAEQSGAWCGVLVCLSPPRVLLHPRQSSAR